MHDDYIPTDAEVLTACEILTAACHHRAKRAGWWTDLKTGLPLVRNVGEMIALEHSELSESLEAARKNLMDDHLPQFKGETVEAADAVIRIFDRAGGRQLDIGAAMAAKLVYNDNRADHKKEARTQANGKAF